MLLNPYRFVSSAPPVGEDPYWEHVKALLHLDGADGSTAIVDATGRAWTARYAAVIRPARARFGSGGLDLTDFGYVDTNAKSADLSLNGDYTVECVAQFDSTANSPHVVVFQASGSRRAGLWYVGGRLRWYVESAAFAGNVLDAAFAPSVGTRYHLAVTRQGQVYRLFIDGALVATADTGATSANISEAMAIELGFLTPFWNYGDRFVGGIDEFRFTRACRYTASFAPPAEAFPNG